MENLYKQILLNVAAGKIEREAAVQLMKELKKVVVRSEDIAIIGMALRFPSADRAKEYWTNIRSGMDCIREFPQGRRDDIDQYLRFINWKGGDYKFAQAGFLEEIDAFDYKFFRLTPKEASLMDPNQRMFLQTAWQAMEDAGYGGQKLVGTNTGVYVGFAATVKDQYQRFVMDTDPESLPLSVAGNLAAIIPSRLSYLLDLKGPTLTVDTACSSALLAVHLACQGIRNGDCEQALVGGIKLHLVPLEDQNLTTGTEASDGKTRAFDSSSDGAGMGEGSAAVFLKPLSAALRDKDNIYAVIKGSATNQDGKSIGITAPNPAAQTEVIVKAWENAGVDPETISYCIAHGTGTKLGDPIEIDGLTQAFRRYTDRKQFCAITSVKANIGHLYECAGMANLIKGVLALQNKEIPPSIHFNKPNAEIPFEDSPVYVNTRLRQWQPPEGTPRRCGISSFGFSGTNVHVILEEPLVQTEAESQDEWNILTLSAHGTSSLQELVLSYVTFFAEGEGFADSNLCYTANTGRDHYGSRLAFLFKEQKELVIQLETLNRVDASKWTTSLSIKGVLFGQHQITERQKAERNRRAQTMLKQFVVEGKRDLHLLQELGQLYVEGCDPNWEELYAGGACRRVSLPHYPFERKRCWIQIPETRPQSQMTEPDIYFQLNWKQAALAASTPTRWQPPDTVMLFLDESGVGRIMAEKMRTTGLHVILVEQAERLEMRSSTDWAVGPRLDDYAELLNGLEGAFPTQIVHLSTLGKGNAGHIDELATAQRAGVESLFQLTRALERHPHRENVELVLVSRDVHAVTGNEVDLRPVQATLFGLARVVPLEMEHVQTRCLDLDGSEAAVDSLLRELQQGSEPIVAYRDDVRFVPEFNKLHLAAEEERPLVIHEDGVYLITGGTGGIGLEMGKWLANKKRVHLALVNRSALPPRDEWDAILSAGDNASLVRKLQGVHELEAMGATVECFQTDITDEARLRDLLEDLKKRHGKIRGIIHGAGLAGTEPLAGKTEREFAGVLAPKVQGTWLLDRLTQQDELDFLMLFSSVATFFAGAGQGDYVAANAYLDAFAAYRNKFNKRTITVNWTTWKEVGMAFDHGFNIDTIFKAMPTAAAVRALDKLVSHAVPHALIGELNLGSPMVYLLEKTPLVLGQSIQDALNQARRLSQSRTDPSRFAAGGEVKATGTSETADAKIQHEVAQILGHVLGYQEINIHDNFFEIGADSVLLKRVHQEVDKLYPDLITIADLFERPTIHKLAQHIFEQQGGPTAIANAKPKQDAVKGIDSIFDDLMEGRLSLDEVAAALDEI